MNIITMPIAKGRARFSELIEKAKNGAMVVLTNHGQPEAVLTGYKLKAKRWQRETPDDPARYGDLQSPVLEEWP